MKTYTFIIGSMDDFEGIEDLMDYVEQQGADWQRGRLNYSCHEFEAPKECDLSTVQLIGYGIAFENDWSQDGTFSFFIEGSLPTESEKDAVQAGIDAREAQKESRLSAQQKVDLYDEWTPNDPRNW